MMESEQNTEDREKSVSNPHIIECFAKQEDMVKSKAAGTPNIKRFCQLLKIKERGLEINVHREILILASEVKEKKGCFALSIIFLLGVFVILYFLDGCYPWNIADAA